MAQPQSQHFQRRVQMGLGEAIRRMVHLEIAHANGFDLSPAIATESKLIMDALNVQYQLDLGFDCNQDGVPDTVEIFAKSAETSCCRILPMNERPSKAKGASRTAKAKAPDAPSPAEAAPSSAATPKPEAAPEAAPEVKKPKSFLSALFGGDNK